VSGYEPSASALRKHEPPQFHWLIPVATGATSSATINCISSLSTRPDRILHNAKQDARIYRAADVGRETSQRFLVSK
jgi:hypothetical protein